MAYLDICRTSLVDKDKAEYVTEEIQKDGLFENNRRYVNYPNSISRGNPELYPITSESKNAFEEALRIWKMGNRSEFGAQVSSNRSHTGKIFYEMKLN